MTKLYGIKNCDKVKAARRWLDKRGIVYRFHDFRDDGIEPRDVGRWLDKLGAQALINRRSTTWRSLTESEKTSVEGAAAAGILCQYPTLIKRPLLEHGEHYVVGFNASDYAKLLGC